MVKQQTSSRTRIPMHTEGALFSTLHPQARVLTKIPFLTSWNISTLYFPACCSSSNLMTEFQPKAIQGRPSPSVIQGLSPRIPSALCSPVCWLGEKHPPENSEGPGNGGQAWGGQPEMKQNPGWVHESLDGAESASIPNVSWTFCKK